MAEQHIVLIDYASGDNGYREFDSLTEAQQFIKNDLEPNEEVEFAQLIIAETLYCWSNPNCCPEGDF
jgi:hypothetical protein